jgi:hypothetical protein
MYRSRSRRRGKETKGDEWEVESKRLEEPCQCTKHVEE